jgi:hypothetical protein
MKLRRIEADSPELEQFIEGTYTDQKQFEGQVANIADQLPDLDDLLGGRRFVHWPGFLGHN